MSADQSLQRALSIPNSRGMVWDPDRREMRTLHEDSEAEEEPETLNEVTNEFPRPLTAEERRDLGWEPPLPNYHEYNARWWGAPTGGGWGPPDGPWEHPKPPRWEPEGLLTVVRTDATTVPSTNALPIEEVAIHLAGDRIAEIGWDRHNEIMLPFPATFFDAETWPNMPGLSVATYNMSTRSKEDLRAFKQIFAWFSRPSSEEGSQHKLEMWASLLEHVLAVTSGTNYNPVDAVRRILEFARSILPNEVWDIVVYPPGYLPRSGWGDGW